MFVAGFIGSPQMNFLEGELKNKILLQKVLKLIMLQVILMDQLY